MCLLVHDHTEMLLHRQHTDFVFLETKDQLA
jgi:hypothetical protein